VKNKRSTLIVDKGFQYSQTMPVVMIAVLAANSVLIAVFFLLGSDFSTKLQTFIWFVAAGEIILVTVTVFYGVKTSNRTAGPVYRLKKVVREVADGDLTIRIRLRKRDHLKDLATEVNAAIEILETRIAAIQQSSRKLRQTIDNHENSDTAHAELDRLLGQFTISESKRSST